jgi:hypothetical protein
MLRVIAPTDNQLRYIADLCEARGLEHPQVIASTQEASEIIDRILAREYDPGAYCYPYGWQEDVPF